MNRIDVEEKMVIKGYMHYRWKLDELSDSLKDDFMHFVGEVPCYQVDSVFVSIFDYD